MAGATQDPQDEPEVFEPFTVDDRDELEAFSDEFAVYDRKWRGFRLTLERAIARLTKQLEKKIAPAATSREAAARRFAQMLEHNRDIALGDHKAHATFNNTDVEFYDGAKGKFAITDDEAMAKLLMAHGHSDIVAISSKVVYDIDTKAAKERVKDDPELRRKMITAGAGSYSEDPTITISATLQPGEAKRGVKPSGYVFKLGKR